MSDEYPFVSNAEARELSDEVTIKIEWLFDALYQNKGKAPSIMLRIILDTLFNSGYWEGASPESLLKLLGELVKEENARLDDVLNRVTRLSDDANKMWETMAK